MEATPRQVPGREVTQELAQMVAMEARAGGTGGNGEGGGVFAGGGSAQFSFTTFSSNIAQGGAGGSGNSGGEGGYGGGGAAGKTGIFQWWPRQVMEALGGHGGGVEDLGGVPAAAAWEVSSMFPVQQFLRRRTL